MNERQDATQIVVDGSTEDRVVRALHRLITDRVLAPGSQIRQEDLADAAGVSRLPVRQVLARLSAEGLVRLVPNRGAYLVDFSAPELRQLHAVRVVLEDEALRLAIQHATSERCDAIEEHMQAVEAAMNDRAADRVARENERFHFAIFECGENSYLTEAIERCWRPVVPYRIAYLASEIRWPMLADHHRRILQALRDRREDHLLAASHEHRDLFVSELIPWLQSDRPKVR